MIIPHEVQEESLRKITELKEDGKKKFLIVLPSGIGKTYLSAFETKNFDGNILYICHRLEILNQAKESFKEIHNIKDKDIGFYVNKRKEEPYREKKVIFATIQTLSKNYKKINPVHFKYIIIDEFHHAGCKTYQDVINYFKPEYLLGMTATPFRTDQIDVKKMLNNNIPVKLSIKEGIEKELLSPFIYYGIWDNLDYSNIRYCKSGLYYKYHRKDLNRTLLIPIRNKKIIEEAKIKLKDRKTIGFCCSIEHLKKTVEDFNKEGLKSVGIHCRLKDKERKQILKDFENGVYQYLFAVDILNEGVDFPDIEGVLLLRPSESMTVFLQQIGRGLRTSEGKKNVMILDFIGNYVSAFELHRLFLKNVGILTTKRKNKKPIYLLKNCEIHFETEVIDLFKRMEKKEITEQKLIDNFYEVKKRFKKLTTEKLQRYGKYSLVPYYTRWGTYKNFLKSIGEDAFWILNKHNFSKEKLEKKYMKLKTKLGKKPNLEQFHKEYGFCITSIRKHFGVWSNLVESMGDKPRRYIIPYTKKDLIERYKDLKKKLGRQPNCREVTKNLHNSTINRLFGSQKKFLTKIEGKDYIRYSRGVTLTKEEVIKEYKELRKKVGRQPTYREIRKNMNYNSAYSQFGNIVNLLKEMEGKDYRRYKKIKEKEIK